MISQIRRETSLLNRISQIRPSSAKSSGHTQGQSIIELSLLVAMVAAALVAVGVYLQRGFQGYLRNSASSHGVQFDPTQPFAEQHRLNSFSVTQDVDVLSGQAAVELFGGDPRVTNIPGGSLPGRTLATKVHVESAWDLGRDKRYEAR